MGKKEKRIRKKVIFISTFREVFEIIVSILFGRQTIPLNFPQSLFFKALERKLNREVPLILC